MPSKSAPGDLGIVQPDIDVTIGGNSAFLDQCEIQVDRGDGKGWVLLAIDTTPNYTDTTPMPATPTKWKYRAIYRVGDHQVGIWSKTVEIMVG